MRKLSSMLALGLAMALTFGMTVSASSLNPSVSTKDPEITNTVLEEAASGVTASSGVTVSAIDVEQYDKTVAVTLTGDIKNKAEGNVTEVKGWVSVFDLKGTAGTVVVNNLPLNSSSDYVVVHWFDKGGFEVISNVTVSGSSITFKVDSFSTFAVVEVVKAGDDDDDDDDDNDDEY